MATDPDRRVPPTGTSRYDPSRYDPRTNAGLSLVYVIGIVAALLLLLLIFGGPDEATTPATTRGDPAAPAPLAPALPQ